MSTADRLRLSDAEYTYPDVVVVCGPPKMHPLDDHTLLNPRLIFEVLSDSTELYDRGAKFGHYRRIEGLDEYVLVAQSERRVEHFRRAEAGTWHFVEHLAGGTLALPALGIEVPVDEIQADLDDAAAE